MKVLVLNPGATSTKISIFEEENEVFKTNLVHHAADLAPYAHVIDQGPFRKQLILETVEKAGYQMTDFDAVCGRGGLLRHIPSGTYAVSDQAIADVLDPPYGEHASNLGVLLARELGDMAGIPSFFVDPVCVDEMTPVAHVTGFKGMERESFFHALNQKSIARKAAKLLGKTYEEARLIVIHMGGGVSVESRVGEGSVFTVTVPAEPLDLMISLVSAQGEHYRAAAEAMRHRTWTHIYNMFIMKRDI